MTTPRNVAAEIRDLIRAHGPLTAAELTALLPRTITETGTRRITGRMVSGRLKPMQSSGLLIREGDRYRIGREVTQYTPELAHERAKKRARDYYYRQKGKPTPKVTRSRLPVERTLARQADYARRRPLESVTAYPMAANDAPLETSEQWMARTGRKPEILRAGDVSPASRFQRIQVAA